MGFARGNFKILVVGRCGLVRERARGWSRSRGVWRSEASPTPPRRTRRGEPPPPLPRRRSSSSSHAAFFGAASKTGVVLPLPVRRWSRLSRFERRLLGVAAVVDPLFDVPGSWLARFRRWVPLDPKTTFGTLTETLGTPKILAAVTSLARVRRSRLRRQRPRQHGPMTPRSVAPLPPTLGVLVNFGAPPRQTRMLMTARVRRLADSGAEG